MKFVLHRKACELAADALEFMEPTGDTPDPAKELARIMRQALALDESGIPGIEFEYEAKDGEPLDEDTTSPADTAEERTRIGNTRTCEDCGASEEVCLCGEEPDWRDIADSIEDQGITETTVEGGGSAPYYIQVALPDGRFILFGNNGETWSGAYYANEDDCVNGKECGAILTEIRSTVTDANIIASAFRDATVSHDKSK